SATRWRRAARAAAIFVATVCMTWLLSLRGERGTRDGDRGGLVSGAVSEQAADRGADGERRALGPGRDERHPHLVEVRVCDHGEPKRVRHPPAVRLAVGGE